MHAMSEDTVKKVALATGVVALGFGIAMAFEYGRAMSNLHAGSLALLAIAVSIAFVGAEMFRNKGRRYAAAMLVLIGFGLSLGEYGTHFGYTVGSRVAETQQTGVQNANHEAIQDNRKSEAVKLSMIRSHLKGVMEERSELLKAYPWAATVKPEGLMAEISVHDKAIELETNRGGCKAKCQELMAKKADLEKRISSAAKFSEIGKRMDDLQDQAKASQAVLDRKVEVATTTEFHSSKIVNQTEGFAQIAMRTTEPSKQALAWTQLVLGAVIALITTYLAPICFWVAFSGDNDKPAAKPQHAVAAPHPPQREIVRNVMRLVDARSACQDKQQRGLCA